MQESTTVLRIGALVRIVSDAKRYGIVITLKEGLAVIFPSGEMIEKIENPKDELEFVCWTAMVKMQFSSLESVRLSFANGEFNTVFHGVLEHKSN